MDKYNELRNKYDTFIYDSYEIEELENTTKITYNFIVPSLTQYKPTLEVKKFKIDSFTKNLIFHIGLVELVSYWKATCSKNVIIKAGYINKEQMEFFKKLYPADIIEVNIDITITTPYKYLNTLPYCFTI